MRSNIRNKDTIRICYNTSK